MPVVCRFLFMLTGGLNRLWLVDLGPDLRGPLPGASGTFAESLGR